MSADSDRQFALLLQSQFDQECRVPDVPTASSADGSKELSVVSSEWETIDPTPDLHALFISFNEKFFWNRLQGCEVRWSPRMTMCAGICRYSPRERFCTIGISIPLLKLRPRKDLVETLLHEMIHAYLFVTDNNKDHDGHGPEFHKHMYRINNATGANISVYHTFHDEVALYKQHWWRCSGPCTKRPPFYGLVKRSMNRAPGPNDRWWSEHASSCGGSFVKIREPDNYGKKGKKNVDQQQQAKGSATVKGQKDIRSFIGGANKRPMTDTTNVGSKRHNSGNNGGDPSAAAGGGGRQGNIFGFGGTSFARPGGGGGLLTKGKVGTVVVRPGSSAADNSSGGRVVSRPADGGDGNPTAVSQGSAPVLGGSGGPEGLSAKEAVRLKWGGSSSAGTPRQPTSMSAPPNSSHSIPLVACPVCGKNVPESGVNGHLDSCLQSSEEGRPGVTSEFDFSDDDDQLLASLSDQLDGSAVAAGDGSAVTISDDSSNDASVCEQDDSNILASLVDETEQGSLEQSMFACPVCDTLVRHQLMNQHLDNCLT